MIFDMLKRLRSVVYLPNDYVCKKVSAQAAAAPSETHSPRHQSGPGGGPGRPRGTCGPRESELPWRRGAAAALCSGQLTPGARGAGHKGALSSSRP